MEKGWQHICDSTLVLLIVIRPLIFIDSSIENQNPKEVKSLIYYNL